MTRENATQLVKKEPELGLVLVWGVVSVLGLGLVLGLVLGLAWGCGLGSGFGGAVLFFCVFSGCQERVSKFRAGGFRLKPFQLSRKLRIRSSATIQAGAASIAFIHPSIVHSGLRFD